jgi:hypothetical protein
VRRLTDADVELGKRTEASQQRSGDSGRDADRYPAERLAGQNRVNRQAKHVKPPKQTWYPRVADDLMCQGRFEDP